MNSNNDHGKANTLASHPMAWTPEQFVCSNESYAPLYVIYIDDGGVAEVEQALKSFKGTSQSWMHCAYYY